MIFSTAFAALVSCSLLAMPTPERGGVELDTVTTPQAYSTRAHSMLSPNDHFRASATMDRKNRLVRISWKFAGDSDFGKPADLYLLQKFAVPFVPTEVEFANPNRIIVAGRLGTATIIEVWHLQVPRMIVAIPPEGGELTSILVGQQRVSVQLVYRHETGSHPGSVRTLIHNRGKPRSTFLRLGGQNDLYELSWPEGSGTGTPVVIVIAAEHPGLAATNYNQYFGGEHVTEGYVYHLSVQGQLDLHDSFVLIDSDKDGAIDATAFWNYADFEAHGALDIANWGDYAGQKPPL